MASHWGITNLRTVSEEVAGKETYTDHGYDGACTVIRKLGEILIGSQERRDTNQVKNPVSNAYSIKESITWLRL